MITCIRITQLTTSYMYNQGSSSASLFHIVYHLRIAIVVFGLV